MGIIQYKDNDFIRKPETGSASVFAVDALHSPVTKEELMSKFPDDVFGDGLGQLDCKYKIKLDESVSQYNMPHVASQWH